MSITVPPLVTPSDAETHRERLDALDREHAAREREYEREFRNVDATYCLTRR